MTGSRTLLTVLIMVIATTFSTCHLVMGQRDFAPSSINTFPDLHPDSLNKYERLIAEYEALLDSDIPNTELRGLLNSMEERYPYLYTLLEIGHHGTGPIGCSWYCATGPNNIVSTSTLEPIQSTTYAALNVHDFDLNTAWVEGAEDSGIGSKLTFYFDLGKDSSLALTSLEIYNGYCKNIKLWKENGRVKKLGLYANGRFIGTLHLEDTYLGQIFHLGSFHGNGEGTLELVLEIKDVFPGTKYLDIAISEINFDGTGDH